MATINITLGTSFDSYSVAEYAGIASTGKYTYLCLEDMGLPGRSVHIDYIHAFLKVERSFGSTSSDVYFRFCTAKQIGQIAEQHASSFEILNRGYWYKATEGSKYYILNSSGIENYILDQFCVLVIEIYCPGENMTLRVGKKPNTSSTYSALPSWGYDNPITTVSPGLYSGDNLSIAMLVKVACSYTDTTTDDPYYPPGEDPGDGSNNDPGSPSNGGTSSVAGSCRTINDFSGSHYLHEDEWFTGAWSYFMFDRWNNTSSPLRVRLYVRTPWGTEQVTDAYDGVTYQWNNGDEHYSIKLDLSYFSGQPTLQGIYSIYECWWKGEISSSVTLVNVVYVAPHGNDSNSGTSFEHADALRSISKGNSMAESGGIVRIQEGFYPSEASISPTRNVVWDLRNYNQATLKAKMFVSKSNFMGELAHIASDSYGYSPNNTTVIDPSRALPSNTTIHFFRIQSSSQTSLEGKTVRLKIFRISGSTFVYVGQSKAVMLKQADYEVSGKWYYDWIPVGDSASDGIAVQAGDVLGLYFTTSSFVNMDYDSSSDRIYIYSGNITSNVAMGSGSRANNSGMGITLYTIL